MMLPSTRREDMSNTGNIKKHALHMLVSECNADLRRSALYKDAADITL